MKMMFENGVWPGLMAITKGVGIAGICRSAKSLIEPCHGTPALRHLEKTFLVVSMYHFLFSNE